MQLSSTRPVSGRPVSPFARIAAAFLVLVGLLAAAPAFAAADEPLVAVTPQGRTNFNVEIADNPESRARGLMFREHLAPNTGMLFDFGNDQDVAFWMKNTPLSLDMIFIRSDGVVMRIAKDTVPFSEVGIPSGFPVRFVLEVEAGTASRIGLKPGDHIENARMKSPLP